MKRPIADVDFTDTANVHHSRKRRAAYTEADAGLAKIYDDLADDAPAVRLKAAGSLLRSIVTEPSDRVNRIEAAVTRLVKGLCSGRKAARLGFSVALSEVYRLAFQFGYKESTTQLTLNDLIENIDRLTQVDGKASGQERRDHLIGRRFAFQALLQSDVAHIQAVPSSDWQTFLKALVELALQKPWLRTECGALLYEYLESPSGKRLSTERLQSLIDALHQGAFFRTPEGVALWLLLRDNHATLLPRGVWQKSDPLSTSERVRLKKLLQGDVADGAEDDARLTSKASGTGSRQSLPSFAWKVILAHVYQRKADTDFQGFWSEVVDASLFADSSSNERKALGLQVLSTAILSAPPSIIPYIFSKNVVRCLLNQRADANRYLFEAARVPLVHIMDRSRLDAEAAAQFLRALYSKAGVNFDQMTKSKTIGSILQNAEVAALPQLVATLRVMIANPGTNDAKQVDQRRRALADSMVALLRTHHKSTNVFENVAEGGSPELAPWLKDLLDVLVTSGYSEIGFPSLSETTRSFFREKLMSCLGLLFDHEAQAAVLPPNYVVDFMQANRKKLVVEVSEQSHEVLASAYKLREKAADLEEKSIALAFRLLYAPSMLQVYNQEPDSVEALRDLNYSLQAVQKGEEESTSTLVELMLSFTSKPSATFRKLAERVFTLLAETLTPESLQSLVEILQTKEGASGQQELFAQHDEGDEDNEDEDEDEVDMDGIDVEDMSDVELVNGEEVDGNEDDAESEDDSGSASASNDQDDTAEEEDGEDEEAVFDRKLAEALGTAGMEEDVDEDDDGSDMDDEQMMALEPSLTNIFKERKKTASKKQDNKEAKENIINFKNRVLDLLMIYVKSQYADAIALDLILPLVTVTRTASTKPTRQKAFDVLQQYFQLCVKKRSLPRPGDVEACFAVLSALHEEMKLGGSIMHADACSRSSLFLSRVLVAIDSEHFERIDKMYAELLAEKQSDAKSNIRDSIFTEWSSWKRNSSEHFGKWASWLKGTEG